MPELDSQPRPPADARAADGRDALGRLAKMSATAGAGTGDYVAVNLLAVVSLLLGLSSVLVLLRLTDVLLVIPAAGAACAIVAWRQVRRSNGTQTGVPLAVAGLALSVLLGGGEFARREIERQSKRSDGRAMAAVIEALGRDVSVARYDEAYRQHFSDRFKGQISPTRFRDGFEEMKRGFDIGGIRAMEWNGLVEFDDQAVRAGRPVAVAGALAHFEKPTETVPRWRLIFGRENGRWVIDDFPDMFPPDRQPRQR